MGFCCCAPKLIESGSIGYRIWDSWIRASVVRVAMYHHQLCYICRNKREIKTSIISTKIQNNISNQIILSFKNGQSSQ